MIHKGHLSNYLFLLILFCLMLPFIQKNTHMIEEPPLQGSINKPPVPVFTIPAWFNGDYQKAKEKQVNEMFGFRSFCIRLNNQIAYTFFNKAQANGVIIGKENYLFEENYIKSYYGTDFSGEKFIRTRMEKLKFIQDTLSKLNKKLIIVVAAGKGFYYPEYFPDRFKTNRTRTNVEAYTEYARKYNISYIDFNQYFVSQKQKYKHLLYPKHGIHWSQYGADLAADSIIRYIEKMKGIDMPNYYWDDSETKHVKEEGGDYDIAGGMNLMFRLPSELMAYPQINMESDAGKVKPSALVISDSFFWSMMNIGIFNGFSNSHFWFYNKQVYPGEGSPLCLSMEHEMNNHEVFIIMATPATMNSFGWGFIERAYGFYTNDPNEEASMVFNRRVAQFREFIKSEEIWLKGAQERAYNDNISLDSSITRDATYQIEKQIEVENKAR